jgi:protein phosphatase
MTILGSEFDLRTGFSVECAAGTDAGRLCVGNEDSAHAGQRLFAVADGVGGHPGGGVASSTVIRELARVDTEIPAAALAGTLRRSVLEANHAIARRVNAEPALSTMATTLTAMLWSEDQAAIAHIGDSRAYLLREGELEQITTDHTLEQLLAAAGSRPVQHGNELTRVLNGAPDCYPDLIIRQMRAGDRYLLCTDGLSGTVEPALLRSLLQAGSAEQAVSRLIDAANREGGPDNITAIVADVTHAPARRRAPLVLGAAAGQQSHRPGA